MVRAHWLTDVLCGAVPLALLTGAWLFHTPLAALLIRLLSGMILRLQPQLKS
ncbi:hypothetical protein [Zobellella endophytica]|uniref:hypothetical protein n=1 Tax=Zobellella endophytica TaxID=2116700 RepID=UPI001B30CD45|nr:hypothetical protein [Zobellella endophytica]